MRILFMGTPEFAVPCLRKLIECGEEVCGVVTQPDKPAGRGHKLTPPPVKKAAEESGISVFQPETLKNGAFEGELERLNPELIIVVAYGKILPEYVLNFPKHGCINMHASLLPKYRGAAPIQWAVINGEKKTGITSMFMEKGLDTGDMLLKCETEIGEYETAESLHDRLMKMSAELLEKTIDLLKKGELKREKQDDALSSYAPMINRETAVIDWNNSAGDIINLIYGMNSYPCAQTLYKGELFKILRAVSGGSGYGSRRCGEIVRADAGGIEVVCGGGESIVLTEVQPKGSKSMKIRDYLNGHSVENGVCFGE